MSHIQIKIQPDGAVEVVDFESDVRLRIHAAVGMERAVPLLKWGANELRRGRVRVGRGHVRCCGPFWGELEADWVRQAAAKLEARLVSRGRMR